MWVCQSAQIPFRTELNKTKYKNTQSAILNLMSFRLIDDRDLRDRDLSRLYVLIHAYRAQSTVEYIPLLPCLRYIVSSQAGAGLECVG